MKAFRKDLEGAYGSITYRRKGAPGRLEPRGEEARSSEVRASKKRLTEEIDDWITNDPTGISPEQARVVALVETADKAFTPTTMSPQEAERLANALDRALDDDE
jgi:hypothetical protein